MEIQRQPTIREFRDRPLGNHPELDELFKGVQAARCLAIYPGSNSAQSHTIFTLSPSTTSIDSDDTDVTTTTTSRKHPRTEDHILSTPLGRVRQRLDTPTVRLVNAVEKMISAPISLLLLHRLFRGQWPNFRKTIGGRLAGLLRIF